MYVTIQAFSEKTGLSPSTLRYYDRKNLLVPTCRLKNGYRAYSETQIKDAIMIHSLRNADVPLNEIKRFLNADETERNVLISKWRQEVELKVASLKIAQQYLGGLNPKQNHLHLVRWDSPVTFIWHRHTVERKCHPFREAMQLNLEMMRKFGYNANSGCFIRHLYSKGNKITGEVGFIVEQELSENYLSETIYHEQFNPMLFASMECSVKNDFLCFQFVQMVRQFGFFPTGSKMEKYDKPESTIFQYLIPII